MSGLIQDNKDLANAVIELANLLAERTEKARKDKEYIERLEKRLQQVTEAHDLPFWEPQFVNDRGERSTCNNSTWDWANRRWVDNCNVEKEN